MIAVAALIINKRLQVKKTIHEPVQQRVTALTEALNARNARVGTAEIAEDVSGVEQILVVDVDSHAIRLLELNTASETGKKEAQQIRDTHVTKLLGKEQPAEIVGSIVIVDFEKHPKKDAILEAFLKSNSGGKP
jgi:hypothetical protein